MFTSRRPAPQVTGISPKEGPPGTRVTIRGENLGVDARDLIGMFYWILFDSLPGVALIKNFHKISEQRR